MWGALLAATTNIRECLSKSSDHHCTTTSLPVILQPHTYTHMHTHTDRCEMIYDRCFSSNNCQFFYFFLSLSCIHFSCKWLCFQHKHEESFNPTAKHLTCPSSNQQGLDVIDLGPLIQQQVTIKLFACSVWKADDGKIKVKKSKLNYRCWQGTIKKMFRFTVTVVTTQSDQHREC